MTGLDRALGHYVDAAPLQSLLRLATLFVSGILLWVLGRKLGRG